MEAAPGGSEEDAIGAAAPAPTLEDISAPIGCCLCSPRRRRRRTAASDDENAGVASREAEVWVLAVAAVALLGSGGCGVTLGSGAKESVTGTRDEKAEGGSIGLGLGDIVCGNDGSGDEDDSVKDPSSCLIKSPKRRPCIEVTG